MDKDQAVQKISDELVQRKGRIITRNIISSALSLFTDPAKSVEKLFFDVDDSISDEKHKLEQDLLLDLVCQVSEAVEEMKSKYSLQYNDSNSTLIDGIFEVKSKNSESVIGVDIKSNSGQVEFKPGTKISVDTENTNVTIGLRIGE